MKSTCSSVRLFIRGKEKLTGWHSRAATLRASISRAQRVTSAGVVSPGRAIEAAMSSMTRA